MELKPYQFERHQALSVISGTGPRATSQSAGDMAELTAEEEYSYHYTEHI